MKATDERYCILEDSVRDMFARAVWSHKIQEKQADIYQRQYKVMETISIVCASFTSVGLLSTFFTDQLWIKIVSVVLSFVTVFIAIYFKSFNPEKLEGTHKEAAKKLLALRNEITSLITSIRIMEKPLEDLNERYCKLMNEANEIYNDAPNTTDRAVRQAKNALQIKGDNTFSSEEIDSYLPVALRKGEKNEFPC